MIKLAVAMSATLGLLGCATLGHAQDTYRSAAGLRVLTDAELHRVLPGRALRSRDPSRLSDAPTGRDFHSDGTFVDFGPRGGAGRYVIQGDAVCREYDASPGWRCENMYVSEDGRYYLYSDLLIVGGIPPYYEVYLNSMEGE